MNPIVSAIEACQSASEVFDAMNRFLAWQRKTHTDFIAYGPLPVQSGRDISAWRGALRTAALQRRRSRKTLDDLIYIAEALNAAWRRLEALGRW